MMRLSRRWVPTVILAMSLPSTAAMCQTLPGQNPPCARVREGQPLQAPPQIVAAAGAAGLDTEFDVRLKPLCVPTTKSSDGTWNTAEMQLRTYVFKDPATGRERWGFPGPTLRLRKANSPAGHGQRLTILLRNNLPAETDNKACSNVCPATQACDCSQAAIDALIRKCTGARAPQECCCVTQCTQKSPNCFHGANTTNLHFHGSHASPQPPQDYVLLDLKPRGSTMSDEHASHGVHGTVAEGEYLYSVDPFTWRQPEGTHWYHPHKHGSVGGQVANGMAGALIIDGPFDDWLRRYYTTEKLIVIQQISNKENFYTPQAQAPQILVNGQISPSITGKPGEVQRWRFVNATMSSGSLVNLTLPTGLEFRQVAMDGVRFSPVNYRCQPLFNFNPNTPSFPCSFTPTGSPSLRFAPGNRADFLVRFPQAETPEDKPLRVERKLVPIEGDERDGARKLLMEREEAIAPGAAEPALFTVVVDDGIPGNEKPKRRRRGTAAAAAPEWRPIPSEWPPMPDYLQNIVTADQKVGMTFQQFVAGMNPPQPWPYNQSPLAKFTIDGRQFDDECANVTTVLDTTAEWTVGNDTRIPHPFHIHTNPFQLMSVKGVPLTQNGAEPVWMDTISMPNATINPSSPPVDPTTPIQITTSQFVIRHRYLDYTGEYVLHCHFLGHEDRGMMFSVQTVCPDNKSKYGVPSVSSPECRGVFDRNALPACK